MTDTGDFSNTLVRAGFGIGGGTTVGCCNSTDYWAAFNNITTVSGSSPVPEPSSVILISTGLLVMALVARKPNYGRDA
jgi:hypothetical protein